MRTVGPERHGHFVRRARVGGRELLAQPLEQRLDRLTSRGGCLHVDAAREEADVEEDVVYLEQSRLTDLGVRVEERPAERRQLARRGRPALSSDLCIAAREQAGRKEPARQAVMLDLVGELKPVVVALFGHGLSLATTASGASPRSS